MFYFIPIEPLEERYTEQWYRWFPAILKKRRIDYRVIDGEALSEKVVSGTFLDINSTLHYKAEQLKVIARLFFLNKIKDGDIFFVADLEFWGIESIRYLADLNNISVKIFGFMHAGSYTREDFMETCQSYAKVFEKGWFRICDKVFVGSEYHKDQIEKVRRVGYDKIQVTGNPYNIKEVKEQVGFFKKKNQVVLTNRPDYEKRPNLSLNVFSILHRKYPDWEFMDADEKIKARANISNEKRLQRLEEKSAWDDDYKKILDKFPELAKHEEEFKKEAYKHPKTVDLETIAKSFLYEPKSETPEPPEVPETPKLGLERPTAGGGNLPSSKLTVETLRDLRKNDHKRYLKVIQAKDFVMPKE